MATISSTGPRGRRLIVSNPHPVGLAQATLMDVAKARAAFPEGNRPLADRRALVIGGTSRGYGAAIGTALSAAGAQVDAVGFSRTPKVIKDSLTAHADWFVANALVGNGVYRRVYFANTFDGATRDRVLGDYARNGEDIDFLVYAFAGGVRKFAGREWHSVLKVTDEPFTTLTLDHERETLVEATVLVATPDEISATVKVMGGGDLELWTTYARQADLLTQGAVVMGLDYIGAGNPDLNRVYVVTGTIGMAKRDLRATLRRLDATLVLESHGRADVLELPAVATTASLHIPIIMRYLVALYGAAQALGVTLPEPIDVGIEVARRFGLPTTERLNQRVTASQLEAMGDFTRVQRFDEVECGAQLQGSLYDHWIQARAGAISGITADGLPIFRKRFLALHGYGIEGVDYGAPFEGEPPLVDGIVNLLAPQAT